MRVLIIGSLRDELATAASIAVRRGAALEQAECVDGALARLRNDGRVDLVLCDIGGHPTRIARLIEALRRERITVPVIACSTDPDPAAAVAALRDGAKEFLPLPPDPDLIAAIIEAATREASNLLAVDPAMLHTLRQASRVAKSDACVLICGESGTGKEVLARYLHQHSRRASGSFVAVNCAAIPEALLESELFGHEKGAFSGAVARRIGRFEAASGGTLLLDEISEMDLRLQAKLLRAIQEREIDRLGGGAPVRIDTRILATSNRILTDEVAAGRFRADLYFRLNVVSLEIPALRDRPHDIVPLARHYAQHYAQTNGLDLPGISHDALRALQAHHWTGNVRELENVMHRAVLLAENGLIEVASLGLTHREAVALDTPASGISGFVGQTMDSVERALIVETLGHTLGNRTHAASLLGISIRALRNKLREYTEQGIAVPAPVSTMKAAT